VNTGSGTRSPDTQVVAAAVQNLAGYLTEPGRYGIAYGSHASDTHGPHSDLDLLLVTPTWLAPEHARDLQDTVIRLHQDHGLHLDTEVAYEVKLIATHRDVQAALDHAPFPCPSSPRRPLIPPVPCETAYLNSPTFRLRLILNALTSPHVFLGGDLTTFTHHTQAAESSLALLAMRILAHQQRPEPLTSFTLTDTLTVLVRSADGATGQDYLGYRPSHALLGTLLRGLHRLAASQVAVLGPEGRWRPGPAWPGAWGLHGALGYWP